MSPIKNIFPVLIIIGCIFFSCKKLTQLPTKLPYPDQSFYEEFDTASSAATRGWKFYNVSVPAGSGKWQDGGSTPYLFTAFSNMGVNAGFIGTTYQSTSAQKGVISNWLISPVITLQNGDTLIFYTRAQQKFDNGDTTDSGNRLQVRVNTNDDGTDVGTGQDPGDFTQLLLDINPTLLRSSAISFQPNAYPTRWTRFEALVSGIEDSVSGRFAFRYFVPNGGSNGNGSGIGIDQVHYKSKGY